MHDLSLQSLVLLEAAYAFVVVAACAWIFGASWRLFRLSGHRGLQLFASAFLFAAAGFLLRFLLRLFEGGVFAAPPWGVTLLGVVFYYALSMFGFLLAYSLVWRLFASERGKLLALHGLALVLSVYGVLRQDELVFFLPQFAALGYAIYLSYGHYRERRTRGAQLFLIALVLAFVGYFANFLSSYLAPVFHDFQYYVYAVTAFVFLLVAAAVYRVTRRG